jgi:tetratricopeptide (TPR) repeat protein
MRTGVRTEGTASLRAVVLFVAVAVGTPASADSHGSTDAPARARLLAARGRAYHAVGDYDGAIASFTAANLVVPSPELLFNLGQAYRLKGDCDNAATMYRRFLASHPDGPAEQLARTQLAKVDRCVAKRQIRLQLAGAPQRGTVAMGSGGAAVDHDDRGTAPGRTLRRAGIGVALGGGALLGIAAYYGVRSADADDDLEEAYAAGAKWPELAAIDARGARADTLATVFAVGGVAAAATGGILYYLGWRDQERAPRTVSPLAIAPRADGVDVAMTLEF